MPLAPASRVADLAAGLLLRSATVGSVVDHAGFRTIELAGERLAGLDWIAGDKLRIRTDGLTLRTYTPISWDRELGATKFLACVHAAGPGSDWCRAAQSGDRCQVRGPDRSVRLDRVAAAPIFVGDETSFGLLLAWRVQRPDVPPVASLFEVSDLDDAARRCTISGATATELVVRAPADDHLDRFGQLVLDAVRRHPDAPLCVTGRAQSIAVVRRLVKSAGHARRDTMAKAYWDVNRKGLD